MFLTYSCDFCVSQAVSNTVNDVDDHNDRDDDDDDDDDDLNPLLNSIDEDDDHALHQLVTDKSPVVPQTSLPPSCTCHQIQSVIFKVGCCFLDDEMNSFHSIHFAS